MIQKPDPEPPAADPPREMSRVLSLALFLSVFAGLGGVVVFGWHWSPWQQFAGALAPACIVFLAAFFNSRRQ